MYRVLGIIIASLWGIAGHKSCSCPSCELYGIHISSAFIYMYIFRQAATSVVSVPTTVDETGYILTVLDILDILDSVPYSASTTI